MVLPSVLPFGRKRELSPAAGDPFTSFRQEMDWLFDEAFRNFGFGSSLNGDEIWSPAIDMRETDKGLEVSADLPGVNEKDVEVTFADGALTIRGERKADREERGDGWHLMEHRHGTFMRTIALPADLDTDKAHAEFKNGVLRVSLPFSPEAERKVRRIKVNAA